MKIIGITGGIGSGKSTVAGFLKELGASVVDLDRLGHEVLKKGRPSYDKVIQVFGTEILAASGEIDRAKLAKIVFGDTASLNKLTTITHPAIDKELEKRLRELQGRGVKVAVLEAAAMLESGKTYQTDELWVTKAPETVAIRRVKDRPGYGVEGAKGRIKSQLTEKERLKHADVVIDTDCTLEELKARVKKEWEKLQKRL